MDLRQLVCAFASIFAFGSFFLAAQLIRSALTSKAGESPRKRDFGFEFGSAMFFMFFGVLQVTVVLMLLVGPWRARPPEVFPLRILDLSVPPSPLDRQPRGP